MEKLYIPNIIHVGYCKRRDTVNGKLGFVIYTDENGVKRQENSWNKWRDHEIQADDFENEPIAGFILNKQVGGYVSNWNYRKSYIRVYDPRGFEFEITLDNLLYILENTNSIAGEGLEGEFVYSWDGKNVVLLPTNSPDYTKSKAHSDLINTGERLGARDMVEGNVYIDKNAHRFVYLGRNHVNKFDDYSGKFTKSRGKYFWYLYFEDNEENVEEEDIAKLKESYENRKVNGTPYHIKYTERKGYIVHFSRITDRFIKRGGEDKLALEYGKLMLTDDIRCAYDEEEIARKPLTIEDINFFNKEVFIKSEEYQNEEQTTIPIGLTDLQTELNEKNVHISYVKTGESELKVKNTEEGYVLELPQRPRAVCYNGEKNHYESTEDKVVSVYIKLENILKLEELETVEPEDVDFTELTFLLGDDSITWVQASKVGRVVKPVKDVEGNLLPVDSFEEGQHYMGVIELTVADVLDVLEIEEVYRGDTLFYKSIVRKENNENEE